MRISLEVLKREPTYPREEQPTTSVGYQISAGLLNLLCGQFLFTQNTHYIATRGASGVDVRV